MKTCKTCGECKPLTMFYQREDGSYRPNCRACQLARNALRYMERVKRVTYAAAMSGASSRCGLSRITQTENSAMQSAFAIGAGL